MQRLYKKEWKLLALHITQIRHPINVADVRMSKTRGSEGPEI